MMANPDVLVIGGGVIGLACAYALAKHQLRVEVLDRGPLGQEASWAGAGIIPPGNSHFAVTAWDRFRAISSELYPAFAEELHDRSGVDPEYRVNGGLEFLSPEDEDVVDLWKSERIIFEKVHHIGKQFPAIGALPGEAHWLPGMAQARNPRLLKALIAACEHVNVRLRPDTPVESIDRTSVWLGNGEHRTAGHVLIACGAWSQPYLQSLGCPFPIHPVRGQMLLFHAPDLNHTATVIVGKQYLVPRADGHFLAGSTEEPQAGFVKTTTHDGLLQLQHFAFTALPALRESRLVAHWAGLRPGSLDGLPGLGFVTGHKAILAAVGHFRAGLQLAPATAQFITDLVLGRTPSVNPEAFALDRPARPTPKLAFRS